MSGVLLTAGYDRAPHSVAVAEGLRRAGCAPDLILIAYPLTVARMRAILRRRGLGAVLRHAGRRARASGPSPLDDHIAAAGLADRSLRAWARRCNVRCASVGDINAPAALRLVESLKPAVTAYTGGGILGRPFLEAAGRRVLNAHSGPLPSVRGMNACEWSLLLGEPLSATIHLVDEGIDTGPVVERIGVAAQIGDTLEMLRERCVVAGIEAMVKHVQRAVRDELHMEAAESGVRSRQCFVMAPAIRELLLRRLPERIEHQRRLAARPS